METGQEPHHWEWYWTEGEMFPGSDWGTVLPETNIKKKSQVPPSEHDLFFRDGRQCVKVFGPGSPGSPMHAVLSQAVPSLQVGRRYRFVVPMYVDVFRWEGEKVPPGDDWAAEVRLGVMSADATWPEGVVSLTEPPWNGSNTPNFYLSTHDFSFDFIASETEMIVYVEVWAKWADLTNGFFMDDLKLIPLP